MYKNGQRLNRLADPLHHNQAEFRVEAGLSVAPLCANVCFSNIASVVVLASVLYNHPLQADTIYLMCRLGTSPQQNIMALNPFPRMWNTLEWFPHMNKPSTKQQFSTGYFILGRDSNLIVARYPRNWHVFSRYSEKYVWMLPTKVSKGKHWNLKRFYSCRFPSNSKKCRASKCSDWVDAWEGKTTKFHKLQKEVTGKWYVHRGK